MSTDVIKKNLHIAGTSYLKDYTFSCGNTVPIYDISTMAGFNQILGYAKFINKESGQVLYRGQCKLYDSIIPSLFRNSTKTRKATTLSKIVNNLLKSDDTKGEINLGTDLKQGRLIVEGLLQHYGVPTRFIDLVDNHWIALWMGLYECKKTKMNDLYFHFQKRELSFIDHLLNKEISEEDIYQYVILLSFPRAEKIISGVSYLPGYYIVDLRESLSSTFLRPHSQHGIVAMRKVQDNNCSKDYDFAPAAIGILRCRIDFVDKWLGNGTLLTQENLFPPESVDKGYNLFNRNCDKFIPGYEIAKFI